MMQVEKADRAVEEGNQTRSAMSGSMMQRLKKASADYEVRTCLLRVCPVQCALPALHTLLPRQYLRKMSSGMLVESAAARSKVNPGATRILVT